MKKLSRLVVVGTVASAGLLAGSSAAGAAPSCIGGSLTYQGANEFVQQKWGLKNLGESFSTQARALTGIGEEQAAGTKGLIELCRPS